MIKIYHNNRCTKSRNGLALLEASGKEFEVIKYLENVPTKAELENIVKLLKIKPIDLVRKNEAVWKSDFKDKHLNDNQIIEAMINNPKLIERPIVINNDKAVIGRPTEIIETII
ncbi:arsenate reductase (glutaredoxin) [Siansivirga zeaxanthinifaciens]|uniref:Arsenate reductase n=1 Tax=Siansivirga zeaxanthinifaciens CC-SAMT-1 TaxID=1454006 RepID=A0A0C5VZ42_9FLAO|nr:arsenate reductase (glutaredoxin) [Siansivirga zeaxanthinifaciens]AJR04311.1 arsenate reductase [Siansivirga zeaxanthinifaciens CC-SAMT-1]